MRPKETCGPFPGPNNEHGGELCHTRRHDRPHPHIPYPIHPRRYDATLPVLCPMYSIFTTTTASAHRRHCAPPYGGLPNTLFPPAGDFVMAVPPTTRPKWAYWLTTVASSPNPCCILSDDDDTHHVDDLPDTLGLTIVACAGSSWCQIPCIPPSRIPLLPPRSSTATVIHPARRPPDPVSYLAPQVVFLPFALPSSTFHRPPDTREGVILSIDS